MAQDNSSDEKIEVENPTALANLLHELIEDLRIATDGEIDREKYFAAIDEAFDIERSDE